MTHPEGTGWRLVPLVVVPNEKKTNISVSGKAYEERMNHKYTESSIDGNGCARAGIDKGQFGVTLLRREHSVHPVHWDLRGQDQGVWVSEHPPAHPSAVAHPFGFIPGLDRHHSF